ncbi:MAG: CotH kinase family protein [Bacteroidetes bacterium]|nr:CotH kinase family protein [Bacteroidota bacterium]
MKYRLPFVLLLICNLIYAQTALYDLNTIQQIEINFTQSNWDYQMDTAKAGAEGYIMAATVSINGSTYDSVGVKYKGNSSYDSTYTKNPIHIALDEFKGQAYQGFTDIKLGNGYADPSQIREVLSYQILNNYMDCPRSNFAQLYINGVYHGLYSNDENINKDFCSEHFYSSSNTFLKCNPIVLPGPTTKSNLKFKTGADSSAYFNFYEVKSDFGWNDLVALCDSLTNHASNIRSILDVDRFIWMLAFNNVLVNLDSYSGVFCQNYYLYKDNTQHFNPIVWDLNMSFGGFPFAGSGATGTAGLTVTNMQQMPLTLHATDPYWPLINAIVGSASYKKMYVAHMRTLVNEQFANNLYQTLAANLHASIDTAVLNDTNGFYSYTQFQNGLTTNYTVGSYTVPGISNLMTARVNYLQATPEFMATPPSITAVVSNTNAPNLNGVVGISANVTNALASSVLLGYRFSNADKFSQMQMFDDGLHNDGVAADNIFGAALTMTNVSLQYYIYAENATAGVFSPERAEHEFYSLQAQVQTPALGQIRLNEFLANNVSDTVDDNGNHSDWIELYNTTGDTLGLAGLYLSDSYSNPQKFAFPLNTLIYPNDYLIIWADDKLGTSALHCNFKLSQNGERIVLSNQDSLVLDSITFGAQLADVSMARCPNGFGPFSALNTTTFNASNCTLGNKTIEENSLQVLVFPNPASKELTILVSDPSEEETLKIETIVGQLILSIPIKSSALIDVSTWQNGIYILKCGSKAQKIIVQK